MTHPQAVKALAVGRVIVVDNGVHTNTLGVVLKSNTGSSKGRTFTALVICEQNQTNESDMETETSQFPRPFSTNGLFRPEGACGHRVIDLTAKDISVITTKTLKISADKIIDDFKKRQMPRFK